MTLVSTVRTALLALATLAVSSAAYADSGSISFRVIKAGFVVGGSGGCGGEQAECTGNKKAAQTLNHI